MTRTSSSGPEWAKLRIRLIPGSDASVDAPDERQLVDRDLDHAIVGEDAGGDERNLRHGVAMEILEVQHDLEAVRAMLGHVRRETTQIYAQIRPAQLKRAVEFYEAKALNALSR